MNIKNATQEYLEKTYCHLKNVVLPNNQDNWNNFPISNNPDEIVPWEIIQNEIVTTMKAIEDELKARGLGLPNC
ncbi:hypothetical protein LG301_15510 [Vreelandella venusta]|uniref:hypothetical protein n=1 Tax=Vreelandella venusta TaxID=44935 RepID=UPI00385043BD